jgi:hypothetical protein
MTIETYEQSNIDFLGEGGSYAQWEPQFDALPAVRLSALNSGLLLPQMTITETERCEAIKIVPGMLLRAGAGSPVILPSVMFWM